MVPVTFIVLTYNEEENIRQCLDNVSGWASQVIILDSYSTDATLKIARRYPVDIHERRFTDYSSQRNWILRNGKFKNEWVFFLDADEVLSEPLKKEIDDKTLGLAEDVLGVEFKRRFIWMNRWIRYGGLYPIWLLRMVRAERAIWDGRQINEHLVIRGGRVTRYEHDIVHNDNRRIHEWMIKHNKYATLEAQALIKSRDRGQEDSFASIGGGQASRKRWVRERIWNVLLPPLVRPFLYFFYRYFIRMGFLDGKQGFIYHLLQGLWYPFLIDVKYVEMREKKRQ